MILVGYVEILSGERQTMVVEGEARLAMPHTLGKLTRARAYIDMRELLSRAPSSEDP